MGSSEIWDKYHSCCIGNGKCPIKQEWYLSQISLLPMLLLVQITLSFRNYSYVPPIIPEIIPKIILENSADPLQHKINVTSSTRMPHIHAFFKLHFISFP